MGFESDASVVRELELFIDNDAQLHRQQYVPILKNLMTKHGQGRYNRALAVKLFMYLVDNGAKKYAKEHGGPGGSPWHQMFPKPIRVKVAESLRDSFEDEAELGNYDEYIPKKYQGKVSGKTIKEGQEPEGEPVDEDGPLFSGGTRQALSEAAGSKRGYAALPGLQRTAQYVQDTVYLSKKMHEAFKANDESKAKSHMRGMLAALELGLKGMGIEEASRLVSQAQKLVK